MYVKCTTSVLILKVRQNIQEEGLNINFRWRQPLFHWARRDDQDKEEEKKKIYPFEVFIKIWVDFQVCWRYLILIYSLSFLHQLNRIFYATNYEKLYSEGKLIGILSLCQWLCNFLQQCWKISTFSFPKLGVSQTNRETTCNMGIWVWLEMVMMILTASQWCWY